MRSELLDCKPINGLEDFLVRYKKYQDIDILKSRIVSTEAINFHKKGAAHNPECLRSIEQRWYDHLYDENGPDFSIYDDDYYFAELWGCWAVFSRTYLRYLFKRASAMAPDCEDFLVGCNASSLHGLFQDCKSIVDLGCGIAYTTAALKQLFPSSNVFGTNLENTRQYDFCKGMSEQFGFTVVPDVSSIGKHVDLVVAFEYFEHIENATDHLDEVLTTLTPRFLLIANSFNTRAPGHFEFYTSVQQKRLPARMMTRRFGEVMQRHGYVRLNTKIWNNKPSVWILLPGMRGRQLNGR
jgi:SAM-dependent methyltransferase